MAAVLRHGLKGVAILIALIAWALSAPAHAADRFMPRSAHFVSEDTGIGFVLDRSSELPRLKFDNSEEIFVLRWQPAAGGDRLLLRDDGETVLRISGLGGITLFTFENRRGIPVALDGPAAPLAPVPPSIEVVRDIAGQIMGRLRAETGRDIAIEADWNRIAVDEGARGILFDAIRNAGTALYNVARSTQGRAALARNLERVRFVQARVPNIFIQGNILVIAFSVEQGLAGRPSSYAIGRQLVQVLR